MTDTQTQDERTRVGYVTTSILERFCHDYTRAFTIGGKFTGDWRYVIQ